MRVQLSEKSKAEFIELITKDSITCWFEGDEFVMPSGQGKTAKGIVLGKLLVWQHRQTEVDELTLQVAEMKSRLNDAYTDGQSAMYVARQSKVDELQKKNAWLSDVAERLKVENVVLQAKVDELQVENKILNQAASTHLKNQMHFKKLYDALVEQLYPYAIDLEEPVDGDVNITSQEFINGYNRARECAHYNLLEMMKSNEEYIRAQCGMLGGVGGSDESN